MLCITKSRRAGGKSEGKSLWGLPAAILKEITYISIELTIDGRKQDFRVLANLRTGLDLWINTSSNALQLIVKILGCSKSLQSINYAKQSAESAEFEIYLYHCIQ